MASTFGLGIVGLGMIVLAWPPLAVAADPTATPGPGGDPRSPGEGPGFVGEPLLAIGAVLAIAVLAIALTLMYVRLSRRDAER